MVKIRQVRKVNFKTFGKRSYIPAGIIYNILFSTHIAVSGKIYISMNVFILDWTERCGHFIYRHMTNIAHYIRHNTSRIKSNVYIYVFRNSNVYRTTVSYTYGFRACITKDTSVYVCSIHIRFRRERIPYMVGRYSGHVVTPFRLLSIECIERCEIGLYVYIMHMWNHFRRINIDSIL